MHTATYILLQIISPLIASVNYNGQTLTGSECERSVDVAIIGAGPAGSYFAYRLRDAGLNIELFEYSDRIGGRLFTTTLPNIPDVNLELGGMRYFRDEHVRVHHLVQELNLTATDFQLGFGETKDGRYFLRGKILSSEDFVNGEIPYDLCPGERANYNNLPRYYLEKLIGSTENLTEELLELRITDGSIFYKLTLKEVIDMVASPDGRQLFKDTALYGNAYNNDSSAAAYFVDRTVSIPLNPRVLTVQEGMSSIPKQLVHVFLQSSKRHMLTTNRKLEAISERDGSYYKLHLRKTTTVNGITQDTGSGESVCAQKVVLAIPQFALTRLKWKPLRLPKVKDVMVAVIPSKVSKVFLVFPTSWWSRATGSSVSHVLSDALFRQMYNWGFSNVSGHFLMLASYAHEEFTEYQDSLNSEGELAPGSASGANTVTNRLKNELLHHLGQVFGVDTRLIPEPTAAISQFWTSYPFGGAWTNWRAGYNFTEVLETIQRPSSTDDVYIVGSDISFVGRTSWTESALETVDLVYEKYFLKK